jgi:hypothetical protein
MWSPGREVGLTLSAKFWFRSLVLMTSNPLNHGRS